jgi:putative intracellular protease/amidase
MLADPDLRGQLARSRPIAEVDATSYDIVYFAGGWGAAFDLGQSELLGVRASEAAAAGRVLGGICHGPLALRNATKADGSPLVAGRKVTAVTDKQVRELRITATPMHPETELRKLGALFESQTRFRDPLANHWVVDGNLVTGQNQNAGPMVAREMVAQVLARTPAG